MEEWLMNLDLMPILKQQFHSRTELDILRVIEWSSTYFFWTEPTTPGTPRNTSNVSYSGCPCCGGMNPLDSNSRRAWMERMKVRREYEKAIILQPEWGHVKECPLSGRMFEIAVEGGLNKHRAEELAEQKVG